ncbi:MAG: DUF4329 domain-containing protein [Cyanobacteria bacterium J06632_22]
MSRRHLNWVLLSGILSTTTIAVIVIDTGPKPGISLSDTELDALDEFAVAHLDTIQNDSFRDGVEYCGYFGYDRDDTLVATPAIPGHADGCAIDPEPRNFTLLATYHTHGAHSWDADAEVPSVTDLTSDIADQTYGYIATPGGRVWFNDWETKDATLLCGKNCVEADPNFQDCKAFLPGDYYTVPELKEREQSDMGTC